MPEEVLESPQRLCCATAAMPAPSSGEFRPKTPMTVEVTAPKLDALALSGSGIVTAEGVHAASLVVRVPGVGVLVPRGTADRLDAGLAGSGDVQLQDLVAGT